MSTVTNSTSRKNYSDLIKGYGTYQDEAGVDFYFATVNVKGSAAIDPIGTMLEYNATGSAFYPVATKTDWEASKLYAKGTVVVPTTRNGYEYVSLTADTSAAAEPTWPTVPGATVVETGDQAWICRIPYGVNMASPLPNKSSICVTCGTGEGRGFATADVTLTSTAQKFTVLFRGAASVAADGLEIAGIDADDVASFKTALENIGISIVASTTDVVPSYI